MSDIKLHRFPLLESTIKNSKPNLARDLVILRENFFIPYYNYLDTVTPNKLFEGKPVQDVNALFSAIKQELDSGTGIHQKSNLTFIGKIVDKFMPQAMADKFFKNLPDPSSSQPVQGFEQQANQAISKLPAEAQKQVQPLVDAGKKNPKLQGYLLGAMVAVAQIGAKVAAGGAGAVGGPLAGAAVGAIAGGLVAGVAAKIYGKPWGEAFKQGVKGALAGAATGALGGLLGGLLGGGGASGGEVDTSGYPTGGDPYNPQMPPGDTSNSFTTGGPGEGDGGTTYTIQQGDTLSDIAARTHTSVDSLMKANPDLTNPDVLKTGQEIKLTPAYSGEPVYKDGVGTAADTFKKIGTGQYTDSPISQAAAQKAGLKESYIDQETTLFYRRLAESKGLGTPKSVHLTNEGIGDLFSKAGSWLKTKAQNVTQKVTIDKINQAWAKSGSPTDSDQIYTVLRSVDVPADVINKVYGSMGLPLPGGAQGGASGDSSPQGGASGDSGASTPQVTGPNDNPEYVDRITGKTRAPADAAQGDASSAQGNEIDQIRKNAGISSSDDATPNAVKSAQSSSPDAVSSVSNPTAAPANPLDIDSISNAYKEIANWDDRNKFRKDLLAKLDAIEDELEAGKVERGTNESKNFKFRSRFLGIEI
jgi:LysM repeat protein